MGLRLSLDRQRWVSRWVFESTYQFRERNSLSGGQVGLSAKGVPKHAGLQLATVSLVPFYRWLRSKYLGRTDNVMTVTKGPYRINILLIY